MKPEATKTAGRAECAWRMIVALLLPVALLVAWWTSYAPIGRTEAFAQRDSSSKIRFAAIGDFGSDGQAPADVANLVASWKPDFVITMGDNNYPDGAAS